MERQGEGGGGLGRHQKGAAEERRECSMCTVDRNAGGDLEVGLGLKLFSAWIQRCVQANRINTSTYLCGTNDRWSVGDARW